MDIQDAEMLAFLHMEEYELYNHYWHFDFQNKKVALGTCSYRDKRISLSKWYVELNEEDEVEDTILHEIAHALSYIRHGLKGIGHGRIWKSICREIGATPERVHKGNLNHPDNHYKYVDACGCGITYRRHRKSRGDYHCPKCEEPLYDKKAKVEWLASKRILDEILECA